MTESGTERQIAIMAVFDQLTSAVTTTVAVPKQWLSARQLEQQVERRTRNHAVIIELLGSMTDAAYYANILLERFLQRAEQASSRYRHGNLSLFITTSGSPIPEAVVRFADEPSLLERYIAFQLNQGHWVVAERYASKLNRKLSRDEVWRSIKVCIADLNDGTHCTDDGGVISVRELTLEELSGFIDRQLSITPSDTAQLNELLDQRFALLDALD